MKVIDLTEHAPSSFSQSDISEAVAERLYRDYSTQLEIDFPSIKTNHQYRITPKGWVGFIPAGDDLAFRLNPKVPVRSVFGMLEYAFRLHGFRLEGELTSMGSLSELYSELASLLARRIGLRWRRGLHRAYVGREDRLATLRGRLDVDRHSRTPWATTIPCSFEEHTADIADNQLLAWTLHRLLRSGGVSERVRPQIRHAYQRVSAAASVLPFTSSDCIGRQYDRLNQDYEVLHALCRFFLDCSGPTHGEGDRAMQPFLIDMASLFELFVAEWLAMHLPSTLRLKTQYHVSIGDEAALNFHIDLVIADAATGRTRCVLDTKYKAGATQPCDVYQLVTYATATDCFDAILIYPSARSTVLDEHVGSVNVRSAVFELKGDLEAAGNALLARILTPRSSATPMSASTS